MLCKYSTVTYNTLQCTTQTPLLTNPPPTGLHVMWVFHCYIQYLTVYNTDSSTDESTTYRFTCYVSIPLLHTTPYSVQHRLLYWRIHHLQVYMLCEYSTVTYNALQCTTQTPPLTNPPPTGLHVMWVFHCYIQYLTVYNTDSSTDESTTYRFTCYVSIHTVTYNALQCTTQTPLLTSPPPTGLPAMWVFHCYIQYLTVYNTDASTDESTTYRFTCYVSIPLLHTIPYSIQHRRLHWRIHHLQVYLLCEYSTVTYNTLQCTTQTPPLTNPPPTGLHVMWVFHCYIQYLTVYNTDASTDESTTYRFTCYVSIHTVTYNALQCTTQTPLLTNPPPTGLHVMWVFHCYIQYLTVYNTDASTDESTTYRFTCYVSIPLLHTIPYSIQHRLHHWRVHHLQVYLLCEYSTVTYNTLQYTTQTPPLTNPPPTGLPAMWVFHCYIQYLTVYNTDSSTDESTTYRFTCYVSIPLLHTIPYSIQHRLLHWRIYHLQVYLLCEYPTVTYNTLQCTTQTPLLMNPPPTGLHVMWVFILLHTIPYSIQHRRLHWRIHHLQVYMLCEYSTVTYNTLQYTTQTPPLTNPPPTGLHVMWVFHCYIQYLTVYNTDSSTDESTTYRFTCYVSIPLLHTIPYSIQHRLLYRRIHHLQVYLLCEYSTVTYNTLQYTTQTPPLTNPPPTGLHAMWVFHCYIQYLTVYNTDSSTDESTTYRFTCYVSIPLLHTIPYSIQHRLLYWRIHHLQVYLLCEYSTVTYNTLQYTTQTPLLTNPPPTGLHAMWVFHCYIQYLTVYNTDSSTDESTTYRFTCYVSIPLLHTIPYSIQHRLLYWRIHHLQVYMLCEYSTVTYNTSQYTTQTPLLTNPPPTGLHVMWVFWWYNLHVKVFLANQMHQIIAFKNVIQLYIPMSKLLNENWPTRSNFNI